jgi:hypothetical protein
VFFEQGVAVLGRVTPAFASLLSQPKVLTRFHGMVGGDAAFSLAPAGPDGRRDGGVGGEGDGGGFGEVLTRYLQAEQELGRIDAAADSDAVAMLVVGAIHGQVLPRVLVNPAGGAISMPPGLADRLARAVIAGIAPP